VQADQAKLAESGNATNATEQDSELSQLPQDVDSRSLKKIRRLTLTLEEIERER